MLSRLPFGAFLSYDPDGTGTLALKSQEVTYQIKHDVVVAGLPISQHVARRMQELVQGSELDGFLPTDAVLVPVPRRGLARPGGLWPALRIAQALRGGGFGSRVAPLVVRTIPIRQSSTAPGALRPWPDQHYASLAVERILEETGRIVLIDDVVTRGSTLLGAPARLGAC